MNDNIARDVLELPRTFSKQELKKCYYRKCLLYHPDKTHNGDDTMFKRCNEAYEYLLGKMNKTAHNKDGTENDNEDTVYSSTVDYMEILQKFLSTMHYSTSDISISLIQTLQTILQDDVSTLSTRMIEHLDLDTLTSIYEFLLRYKVLFTEYSTLFTVLKDAIQSKQEASEIYELQVSLEDAFSHSIYVLDCGENKKRYIPLWHDEVHFKDCIVYIMKECGDEIWLDEDNNVHVKCILTTEEMMSGDTKTITLYEGNNIQIPCSELYCRSYQTYRIYKQGIPQIHETNIFDTTQRSDIVVHVFHKK